MLVLLSAVNALESLQSLIPSLLWADTQSTNPIREHRVVDSGTPNLNLESIVLEDHCLISIVGMVPCLVLPPHTHISSVIMMTWD